MVLIVAEPGLGCVSCDRSTDVMVALIIVLLVIVPSIVVLVAVLLSIVVLVVVVLTISDAIGGDTGFDGVSSRGTLYCGVNGGSAG